MEAVSRSCFSPRERSGQVCGHGGTYGALGALAAAARWAWQRHCSATGKLKAVAGHEILTGECLHGEAAWGRVEGCI